MAPKAATLGKEGGSSPCAGLANSPNKGNEVKQESIRHKPPIDTRSGFRPTVIKVFEHQFRR